MKPVGQTYVRTVGAMLVSAGMLLASPVLAEGKIVPQGATAGVSYNWHANARTVSAGNEMTVKERKHLARQIKRHGSGSYICSPSGFGKKSKCFERG